jgi:hypothetical protein
MGQVAIYVFESIPILGHACPRKLILFSFPLSLRLSRLCGFIRFLYSALQSFWFALVLILVRGLHAFSGSGSYRIFSCLLRVSSQLSESECFVDDPLSDC